MLFYDLFRHDPKIKSLPAGEILFREGEPGDLMYVLIQGKAEIHVGANLAETLDIGGIVGEMGVIDGSPRSATVIATTRCEWAEIDKARFHFLVAETPRFAIEVMQVMARRLRRADASVSKDST